MASITYTFLHVNTSVQVGDTAYYTNPTLDQSATEFDVANTLITLGTIVGITDTTITVDVPDSVTPATVDVSFIFFNKSNVANMSSIKGYYGSAKYINNSEKKAEMFATACEINESSK
jgi:hypothetical protein